MHGPIRDRLEDLLTSGRSVAFQADSRQLNGHLSSCDECSEELEAMRAQAARLAAFRVDQEQEPAPGFYARVLQRIEEQTYVSVWSLFLESPFSKRLALASLTIAVAVGTYVVGAESRDGHIWSTRMVAQSSDAHYDLPVIGSQSEQRDLVLANFAEHRRIVQ